MMRYLLIPFICLAALTGIVVRAQQAHWVTELQMAAFSKDGKYVYTYKEGTVLLYEAATGQLIQTFGKSDDPMNLVTLSPDNKLLLNDANGELSLWSVETGKKLPTHFTVPDTLWTDNPITFSSDSKQVLYWNYDANSKRDVRQGFSLQTGNAVNAVWMPDEFTQAQIHLFANDRYALAASEGSTFSFWDTNSGKRLGTYPETMTLSHMLGLTADNKTLVIIDQQGQIQQWDTKTFKLIGSVPLKPAIAAAATEPQTDTVTFRAALSPDGKLALVGYGRDYNQLVEVINVQTGEMVRDLTQHQVSRPWIPLSLGFSANGDLALIGYWYEPVQLWDVKTGQILRTLTDTTLPTKTLTLSAPLYMLLSSSHADSSGSLIPYQLGAGDFWKWTGAATVTQVSHQGYNLNAVASPDGKYIAYQALPQTTIDFLKASAISPTSILNYTLPINIWILNTQTEQANAITDQKASLHVDGNDLVDGTVRSVPVWSPDSTKIAWLEAEGLSTQVYLNHTPANHTPVQARLMVYDLATQQTAMLADNVLQGNFQQEPALISSFRPRWSSAGILVQAYSYTEPDLTAWKFDWPYVVLDSTGMFQAAAGYVHYAPGYLWVADDGQQYLGFWLDPTYTDMSSFTRWTLVDPRTGEVHVRNRIAEAFNPLAPDGSALQFDGKWQFAPPDTAPYQLDGCQPSDNNDTVAISPDGTLAACGALNFGGDASSIMIYATNGLLTEINVGAFRVMDLTWGALNWRVHLLK